MGNNDMGGLFSAMERYTAGGAGYVDPVAFENVFEDIDGVPTLTFAPVMRVSGANTDTSAALVGITYHLFEDNV